MLRVGLVVAVTLFLGSCAPSTAPKMHDLYVYGVDNARYSYFYGEPTQLTYAGQTLSLTAPEGVAARAKLLACCWLTASRSSATH